MEIISRIIGIIGIISIIGSVSEVCIVVILRIDVGIGLFVVGAVGAIGIVRQSGASGTSAVEGRALMDAGTLHHGAVGDSMRQGNAEIVIHVIEIRSIIDIVLGVQSVGILIYVRQITF